MVVEAAKCMGRCFLDAVLGAALCVGMCFCKCAALLISTAFRFQLGRQLQVSRQSGKAWHTGSIVLYGSSTVRCLLCRQVFIYRGVGGSWRTVLLPGACMFSAGCIVCGLCSLLKFLLLGSTAVGLVLTYG